MNVEIFITYVINTKDVAHFNKINNGLVVIKTYFLQEYKAQINIFHKGIIMPGERIDIEIKKHLDKSHIILLLISNEFLAEATEAPFQNEFVAVVKKHLAETATVVPILLESCLWELSIFKDVQPLPRNKIPISACKDRAKAYKDLHVEIVELIKKFIDRRGQEFTNDGKIIPLNPKPTKPTNFFKMVEFILKEKKVIIQ